jgi:hypothetical protein
LFFIRKKNVLMLVSKVYIYIYVCVYYIYSFLCFDSLCRKSWESLIKAFFSLTLVFEVFYLKFLVLTTIYIC